MKPYFQVNTEPVGAGTPTDTPPLRPALDPGFKGSLRRVDLACLAVLGSVWITMAALANPIGDFPLNDDWVYGLSVKAILEHGGFRLPSPASSNLISQAYWGALFCLPFGFSFTALRVSTLVLGLVGVWATFGILRELGARSRIALFAAALVAGNPLYFALANTFMTDVPFFAVSAASLFFLVRWTFHLNTRDVLLGLLLSMLAILIRQAGIVILLAFAIAYVVKRGPRFRTIAVAIIPLLIGALLHFGFQAWLHQSGRTPAVGEPPLLATVAGNLNLAFRIPLRLFVFFAYTAMFSLPILAVASWRTWRRSDTTERRMLLAVFGAALVWSVIGMTAFGRPMPFIDNVLYGFGMGPLTLTDTYFLNQNFPDVPAWLAAFWYAATFASILGIALLACMVAYGLRGARGHLLVSPSAPAMIIIVCSGVAYMLLGALALQFFYDRYILFLLLTTVIFIGSLAAETPSDGLSKNGSVLLALVLTLQAAFAVVATRDYIEWNRKRWAATSTLIAAGVPRTSIDGGYEFNGWFGYDPNYRIKRGKSPWWVTDDEYVIASGPVAGYSVFRAYPFRRLLTGRQSEILVLRRDRP